MLASGLFLGPHVDRTLPGRPRPSPSDDPNNWTIPLRLPLVSTDLLSAAALAAAVLLVAPGDLSRTYALIVIATSVVPGLMLTGDVKMLNGGVAATVSHLRFKVTASTLTNVLVGGVTVVLVAPRPSIALMAVLVIVGALGATAQAFSSVWYYTQADKSMVLRGKAASASVKIAFASVAVARSELALALLGMSLGAMVEFSLNFRSLPWRAVSPATRRRELISMLGVAYGVSRLVSAAIRLGLSQLFGSLIASFLILEQLVGGINSVFEKYFLRSKALRRTSKVLKVIYLLVMVAVVPWLVANPPQPDSRLSLAWLTLVACAGLLPLSEMYSALHRRGQSFVGVGSIIVSLTAGVGIALAAWWGNAAHAALVAYVALPGATFFFYWIASINVRHNTKR